MKVYCFTIEYGTTQKSVYVAGYSEHDARVRLKRAQRKSREIGKRLNVDTFKIIGNGKEMGTFIE